MWSQNLIEVLKLLASIATPLAIAFIGVLINRAIQRQNATTQRQSSWLVKWADDFLKATSGFNDSATSFLMVYSKSQEGFPGAVDSQQCLHLEIVPHLLDLERARWEMSKFAGFASATGKGLEKAAEALLDEVRSWAKNKGGNVQEFRQKQLTFNINVRKVHAELLRLKDSKEKYPLF